MGLPGIVLLLLRTTVGLTMVIRDSAYLPEAADRPVVYVATVFGESGRRSSLGWLSHYVCRHRRGMVAMLTAFKVLPSWRSGVNRFGRTDAFDCLLLKEGWEQGDATERNSRREETRHSSADVKIAQY